MDIFSISTQEFSNISRLKAKYDVEERVEFIPEIDNESSTILCLPSTKINKQ